MRHFVLFEPLWQPWPALAKLVAFTHFHRRDKGLEGSMIHCLVSVQVVAGHIYSIPLSVLTAIGPLLLTHASLMVAIH